jgi:hypothetical protein
VLVNLIDPASKGQARISLIVITDFAPSLSKRRAVGNVQVVLLRT